MRKLICRALGATLLASLATAGMAQDFYSFNAGWGNIPTALTPNGSVAVGISDGSVFRWTSGAGSVAISPADITANWAGVSNDGNTIISTLNNPGSGFAEASIWRAGSGWEYLGGTTAGVDNQYSSGWDVSGDGTKATGLAWHPTYRAEAFGWQNGSGMTGLGQPPGSSSRGTKISRDGHVVVGFYENETTGERRAAKWVDGGPVDLFLGESSVGEATAVNTDGTLITGDLYYADEGSRAYLWDGSSATNLGMLAEHASNMFPRSVGNGISDNEIVVGYSGGASWMGDLEGGFVWTAGRGMVSAREYLESLGVVIPSELDLTNVTAISADGSTIAGIALNTTTFENSVFVATTPVPEPASLVAMGLGALVLARRRTRK